ncbi:MlaE family ABC transporter permease [Cellvibrio japonicus]|uniref:ABC-type transport system, permease component n=1 Tax=Cellvibrio japonicus (strain Ueda107) TaxID=498211 RepID=B3PEA0_CELJU|nr:ABC transporter permease [Cellvibrio japonicus]ACE83459.1 ABC-type transport system, permease component [Cellvibrio japonicus Ueda107]QEI12140.1 ABC transporter permease [Cellvibrio japonicus]QEI15714.1 ABC transporter permease [Cellvibrio japonicus]QEI19292.1 ABC transporter permease [Cellvibrio japonicus]
MDYHEHHPNAGFQLDSQQTPWILCLYGNWQLGSAPDGATLCASLMAASGTTQTLQLNTDQLGTWDSSLAIALLQLARWCDTHQITLDIRAVPEGLQQLLRLATAIPPHQPSQSNDRHPWHQSLQDAWQGTRTTLIFIGDTSLALSQWVRGQAKTRRSDIAFFIEQAGPRALAIVTLIALLVGMILAYLGSVQLRQLGAQVYVADLVALGMVREMGALMTAVIMAGRTGAAYAAQLGTMQVNEEIDALKTMGISSIEFLVLPRLLALVLVMPLLCIYANVIGMVGGALVATSMDVNFIQYILQTQGAVGWVDISTGLVKSVFFGVLIAIAGCQAGIHCGRNSDAVGMAATNAVVRAIVYLVVADAAFNILYDKLGI